MAGHPYAIFLRERRLRTFGLLKAIATRIGITKLKNIRTGTAWCSTATSLTSWPYTRRATTSSSKGHFRRANSHLRTVAPEPSTKLSPDPHTRYQSQRHRRRLQPITIPRRRIHQLSRECRRRWKPMLKFGHPKLAVVPLLGMLFLGVGVLAATAAIGGVRINTSYSLPLGIYVRTHDREARLIEFCPVEPFASESSERGYRTHGMACADGAVPLLKPIVAVAGDRVVLSAEGMRVNGRLASEDRSVVPRRSRSQPPSMAVRTVCCRRRSGLGGLHLQSRQLRLPLHGSDQNLPDPREAPPTMASLVWFRIVAAGTIGLIAWRGQLWAIPLSILVPCLIAVQPSSLCGRCHLFCLLFRGFIAGDRCSQGVLAVQ